MKGLGFLATESHRCLERARLQPRRETSPKTFPSRCAALPAFVRPPGATSHFGTYLVNTPEPPNYSQAPENIPNINFEKVAGYPPRNCYPEYIRWRRRKTVAPLFSLGAYRSLKVALRAYQNVGGVNRLSFVVWKSGPSGPRSSRH